MNDLRINQPLAGKAKVKTVSFSELTWRAGQGHKGSQKQLSEIFKGQGRLDEAEYWLAKAERRTSAFSVEVYKAQQNFIPHAAEIGRVD